MSEPRLYTLGNRALYRKEMAKGPLTKCIGGFAFPTPEEARAFIVEHQGYVGLPPEAFAVFEMELRPTKLEQERCQHCGLRWAPALLEPSPILREMPEA